MTKNRLPPFVPLLITTLDSRAWKALSHGARSLYVSLRRRVPNGRNKAYLCFRHAEKELRSSRRKIGEWCKELEHYGFVVLAEHGCLGVDGKGKSPHLRLTELGVTSKTSAGGLFEPPTNDFLKWTAPRLSIAAKHERSVLTDAKNKTPVPTGETVRFRRGKHPCFRRRKRLNAKPFPTG
jgi:hypothetical protein